MVPDNSTGISRVPAYSGADLFRGSFRVRGSHPLWRAAPCASTRILGPLCRSYNPGTCLATPPVWAPPRSLAATGGIVVTFSSWRYLDVSVPTVRLPLCGMPGSLPAGCPIRTSADHWAFAPPRGFSQLVTSFFASESPGIPHAPFRLRCAFAGIRDSPPELRGALRASGIQCLPWFARCVVFRTAGASAPPPSRSSFRFQHVNVLPSWRLPDKPRSSGRLCVSFGGE